LRSQLKAQREAGGVHEDVDVAEARENFVDAAVDGVAVSHVEGDADGARAELFGERLQAVFAAGRHDRAGAVAGEAPRAGGADAGGGAGDENDGGFIHWGTSVRSAAG